MLPYHLVRPLTLRDASPAFLSAASGLCWLGDNLYVIADDALHLGAFSATHDNPGQLYRLLPGELPVEHKARKASKPDFEVLTHWATYAGSAGGALLALGSGSKPNRCTGVLIPLDAHYALVDTPIPFDLAPLYTLLASRVGSLNIEGAVVQANELWLFQRGNSEQGKNALIKLPLTTLEQCIAGHAQHLSPEVLQIVPMELGTRDGVALTFTDATGLPDGNVIFTAAAENTGNTYDDGACAGSALGMISSTGTLLWTAPLEGQDKIEGISVQVESTSMICLLVTDADDANVAAKLLRTELNP